MNYVLNLYPVLSLELSTLQKECAFLVAFLCPLKNSSGFQEYKLKNGAIYVHKVFLPFFKKK